MAKYLVKFVEQKYLPDFQKLDAYSIRLGSFLDYKETEDLKRQDKSEGQRGLHLTIKRPCRKLDEFIEENKLLMPKYTSKELDKDGNFIPKVTIFDHEHLDDFNAWIFCCSIVEDLQDVEKIKNKFKADSYYFISNIDKFSNAIQKSLSKNLQDCPVNKNHQSRIHYPNGDNVYLDGFNNIVTYGNDSKYMNFNYHTLTDYIASKDSRTIDKNLWFKKGINFKDEKEFRFILYPTSGRTENKHYNINEICCILDVNLNECISKTPIDIEIYNKT